MTAIVANIRLIAGNARQGALHSQGQPFAWPTLPSPSSHVRQLPAMAGAMRLWGGDGVFGFLVCWGGGGGGPGWMEGGSWLDGGCWNASSVRGLGWQQPVTAPTAKPPPLPPPLLLLSGCLGCASPSGLQVPVSEQPLVTHCSAREASIA